MKIVKTELDGVSMIEPVIFQDERGKFIKVFHKDTFIKEGMMADFKESYYTISKRDVLRGMHFQLPPEDHAKLVYVSSGAILDVILDIRKESPTYGRYMSVELSGENHKIIYIPPGFAHGFLSLKDDSCVTYLQTTVHSSGHDAGIKFDSFGMDWKIKNPIISKRDRDFSALEKFQSPFIYKK